MADFGDGGGPPPVRDAHGRFVAGNPGRPFGARGRASQAAARMILGDFAAAGPELLPRMRRWFVPQYVALVARLLPRGQDAGGGAPEALDAGETARLIADTRAALDRIEAGDGTLADLEAALLGAGRGTDSNGD
jgi:hypothetical protein